MSATIEGLAMIDAPIAYHITFGTYGTRLHGDPRLTVDRRHNQFGTPFVDENLVRERIAAASMRFERVVLSLESRQRIEASIPNISAGLGWEYHVAAAQPDHVHLLVTLDGDAKTARRLMKRRLSQMLKTNGSRTAWWAKGGSTKWIWKEAYFRAAFYYIERQRASD
jgi:REP element-mobilizing transposase RayT